MDTGKMTANEARKILQHAWMYLDGLNDLVREHTGNLLASVDSAGRLSINGTWSNNHRTIMLAEWLQRRQDLMRRNGAVK